MLAPALGCANFEFCSDLNCAFTSKYPLHWNVKYEINKHSNSVFIGVEATFTLIDFLLFFSSFLLGFVVGLFFLIFAAAVLQKIFARYEFEFDTDRYEIIKYYRFFGYFRFQRQKISFGDVDHFLLSNYDSGPVLRGKGFKSKEWNTIDIITKSSVLRLTKAENDELDEAYELFEEMQEYLDLYFKFKIEFVEREED